MATWGYVRPEKRTVGASALRWIGLAEACPRDVPEPPSTANGRRKQHPPDLKEMRAWSPRATHGNTLVMRRSSVPRRQTAQASRGQKHGNFLNGLTKTPLYTSKFFLISADDGIVYFEGQAHRNCNLAASSVSQVCNGLFDLGNEFIHEIVGSLQRLLHKAYC